MIIGKLWRVFKAQMNADEQTGSPLHGDIERVESCSVSASSQVGGRAAKANSTRRNDHGT